MPDKPHTGDYTPADRARDYRLVGQALLTVGLLGNVMAGVTSTGDRQLWHWYIAAAVSVMVSSRTPKGWKGRAVTQLALVGTVLTGGRISGIHGDIVRYLGVAALTLAGPPTPCSSCGRVEGWSGGWVDPARPAKNSPHRAASRPESSPWGRVGNHPDKPPRGA